MPDTRYQIQRVPNRRAGWPGAARRVMVMRHAHLVVAAAIKWLMAMGDGGKAAHRSSGQKCLGCLLRVLFVHPAFGCLGSGPQTSPPFPLGVRLRHSQSNPAWSWPGRQGRIAQLIHMYSAVSQGGNAETLHPVPNLVHSMSHRTSYFFLSMFPPKQVDKLLCGVLRTP